MNIEITISEEEIKDAIMDWMSHDGNRKVEFADIKIEKDDIRFCSNDLGSLGIYTKAIIRKNTDEG